MLEEPRQPTPSQQELARNVLGIRTEQEAVNYIAPALKAFYGIEPEFPIHSEQALQQAQDAKLNLLLALLANGAIIDNSANVMLSGLRKATLQDSELLKYSFLADTKKLNQQAVTTFCNTLNAIAQHRKIRTLFAPQATSEYDTDNMITDRLQRRGFDVQSTTHHASTITPGDSPFNPPYATGTVFISSIYEIASLPMQNPTDDHIPYLELTTRRVGTPDNPTIVFEKIDLGMLKERIIP